MSEFTETNDYDLIRDTNRLMALTNDVDKAKIIAGLKAELQHFTQARIDGLRNVSVFATLFLTSGITLSLLYAPLFYAFVAMAIFGITAVIYDTENHLQHMSSRTTAHVITNAVSGIAVIVAYITCALQVWDTGFMSVFSALSLGIGVVYLLATQYNNTVTAIATVTTVILMTGMAIHVHHAATQIILNRQVKVSMDIFAMLNQTPVQVSILILLSEMIIFVVMNTSVAATVDYVVSKAPTVVESIGETQFAAEAFAIRQRSYDFFLDFLKTLQTVASSEHVGRFGELEFSASIDPALEISGDFFDIYEYGSNGEVVFWIGDVCGKGANAGIVMSSIQSSLHALLKSCTDSRVNVVRLLEGVNDMIYHVFNEKINGAYMTTMSIFSYRDGHIVFTGEHENVILLKATGEHVVFDTKSYGSMLGMDDVVIGGNTGAFEFKPGDKLVLYSDGFVEQISRYSGKSVGFDFFMASASRYHGESAEVTRQGIINDIKTYAGVSKLSDDATIMVVTR